jgi:signal transduction histidine kinase
MYIQTLLQEEDNACTDTCKIMVSVSDHGIGISERAKSLIFLPFTQADSTTTRKYVCVV